MTDPRALLDAYAAAVVEIETEHRVFEQVQRDMAAPEAINALRAVLDLHPRSVLQAGVLPEMFGPGRCAFCHHGEPSRRYRGDINGRVMDAHEHTDPEPWCFTCEGPQEESSEPWPCPTVRAITTALEAS